MALERMKLKDLAQTIPIVIVIGVVLHQVVLGRPIKSLSILDFSVEFDNAQQSNIPSEELNSPKVQAVGIENQNEETITDDESWRFDCISWDSAEFQVKALYQETFGFSQFPSIPDGFRDGCVFGHYGASFIRVYITANNWRIDETLVKDGHDGDLMGNIPNALFRDDLAEDTIDFNKVILIENTCSSTSNQDDCLDKPLNEPWLDGDHTSCLSALCISIPSASKEELLNVWLDQ